MKGLLAQILRSMFEVVQLSWVLAAGMASLTMALSFFGTAFLGVRSRRERLASGDAQCTHQAVDEELDLGNVPRSYRTFAHAALGEFTSARRALLSGPVSGSQSSPQSSRQSAELLAKDYGLCTCVLMAAFENDSSRALRYAEQLVKIPLEGERHLARRSAVISVARVLAGVVDEEDWEYLNAAPTFEPMMLWPCRYAVASILRASGHREQILRLIGSAPRWPETSHFYRLHAELVEHFRPGRVHQEAA